MKKLQLSGIVALCLSLSGCVDKKINGDVTTFSIALWVTAAFVLGGCSLIYGSRFIPKRTDGWFRKIAVNSDHIHRRFAEKKLSPCIFYKNL